MARAKKPKTKSSLEARAKAAMQQWLNPSNPALEAALFEAITDDARWLVYADWLQQIGDVRGEIIALGLANKTAEATKLATASEEFLWAGAQDLEDKLATRTWTGGWEGAQPEPLEVSIKTTLGRHGMLDTVAIHGLDEVGHVAGAAGALFAAPIARFVRSLELACSYNDRFSGESGQPNLGAVVAAVAAQKPASLSVLRIVTGGYQTSWTNTGDLAPLLAATPYLEELVIEHGDIDLGETLALPHLRTLSLETGGLARENVIAIADATWPALEKLVLFLGTQDYGATTTRADVAKLLATPFPRLVHLGLCNADIQGDIVSELVQSPLLAQLTVLDLSKGTLVDDDIKVIVDNPALFAKLQLDLSTNYLSPEIEQRLAQLFGDRVSTDGQRYDNMVRERAQYGHEEWAKDATFRYTDLGE
jgi:uncharacterized protein (TIGR02996 family)